MIIYDVLIEIKEFQRIVQSFIEMTERLGLEVEKEKMKVYTALYIITLFFIF